MHIENNPVSTVGIWLVWGATIHWIPEVYIVLVIVLVPTLIMFAVVTSYFRF